MSKELDRMRRHQPSEETKRLNPQWYPPGASVLIVPKKEEPAAPATTKAPKKGRQPNATEARYLAYCEALKRRGEIDSYRFEGLTLKWGVDPKTGAAMRYTPDFVITTDGSVKTLIEIKGAYAWKKDVIRFKGCRAFWPEYSFELWQWADGAWTRLE